MEEIYYAEVICLPPPRKIINNYNYSSFNLFFRNKDQKSKDCLNIAAHLILSLVALFLCLLGLASPARAQALLTSWPTLSTATAEPQGGGERDAALVVGVDGYMYLPSIPGAALNAEAWAAHLREVRQVPQAASALVTDGWATRETILERAFKVAQLVQPGGTLWFVFIGQGMASPDGADGMLAGVDAPPDLMLMGQRGVRLGELEAVFSASMARRVVMLIDASFSGRGPNGLPLVPGLLPLNPAALAQPPAKVIRLLACETIQLSRLLPGAPLPAFSYLALGGLRGWADIDRDGQVSADELFRAVKGELAAIFESDDQVPVLIAGSAAPPELPLAVRATEARPDLVAIRTAALAAISRDTDSDGIPDHADACPLEPGPQHPDPRFNGCPPDMDSDGVPDHADACPAIPGVPDANPQKNGCPLDTDSDGIPDHADACPRVPGDPHERSDAHGCLSRTHYFIDVPGLAFRVGRHLVTVAQYADCLGDSACSPPIRALFNNPAFNFSAKQRGMHPINGITKAQAEEFCRWLGGRLPTADEWRLAATNNGRTEAPWQETAPVDATRAHFGPHTFLEEKLDGGMPMTRRVGAFSPQGDTPEGLQDLLGNVWEWTATARDGETFIVLGGAWSNLGTPPSVSAASWQPAAAALPDLGFRCVKPR